jgi:hypothetical protein
VRFLDGEKAQKISEKIHTLGASCWARLDLQLALRQPVVRQTAWLEARHVVSERDWILVLVRGPVNDSIDHWPMVIGKVRA